MPFKKINAKQEIEIRKQNNKEFELTINLFKAIELLDKAREEIENCYSRDTDLTEEITDFLAVLNLYMQ